MLTSTMCALKSACSCRRVSLRCVRLGKYVLVFRFAYSGYGDITGAQPLRLLQQRFLWSSGCAHPSAPVSSQCRRTSDFQAAVVGSRDRCAHLLTLTTYSGAVYTVQYMANFVYRSIHGTTQSYLTNFCTVSSVSGRRGV
jgi:hypothetical protein